MFCLGSDTDQVRREGAFESSRQKIVMGLADALADWKGHVTVLSC